MISLVIRVSNFCFFFDFLYRYGSVRIDLHVLVTVSTECRIEHTFHIVFVQSNQKHDDRSETHSQNLKKRIALCYLHMLFLVQHYFFLHKMFFAINNLRPELVFEICILYILRSLIRGSNRRVYWKFCPNLIIGQALITAGRMEKS